MPIFILREGEYMVVWCRACGGLMGLREPYTDWSVDRNAICPVCAEQEKLVTIEQISETSNSDEGPISVGLSDS